MHPRIENEQRTNDDHTDGNCLGDGKRPDSSPRIAPQDLDAEADYGIAAEIETENET